MLSLLKESAKGPKGRKMLLHYEMESEFSELNPMVSTDTILDYLDRKINFTVHTDVC